MQTYATSQKCDFCCLNSGCISYMCSQMDKTWKNFQIDSEKVNLASDILNWTKGKSDLEVVLNP